MHILHKSVRVAAMLALLGMVLNALWPLLATAEPRPAYFSAEICSVNSSKAAGSVAGKAPLQLPPPKHQNVHCVFCANGVCNASLEGALLTVEALSTESQSVPPAAAPGRKNNDAYLLAESRAPPRFRLLRSFRQPQLIAAFLNGPACADFSEHNSATACAEFAEGKYQ